MQSETLPEARDERLSTLMEQVVGQGMATKMSANQRAMAAWRAANGDRERAHTTRVFLRAPRSSGRAPVLCVYVDSHALATDFSANRDLYLARLANQGFAVSGIEFSVDRNAHRVRAKQAPEPSPTTGPVSTQPKEVPEELVALVETLPESLREKVSKAIVASISVEE